MKKKIVVAIIAILCIIFAIFYTVSHKNKSSNTVQNKGNTQKVEFKVLLAFADVDLDMVIQNKDTKDNGTSGDYIIIKFTNEVKDTKKNDNSNPANIKSYTFDNKSLPDGTKIYIKDKYQIVIKLKNGYLKGINSPHDLIISKNLVDKAGNKLKGNLNLKLPYSNSSSDTSSGNTEKSTSSSNNKRSNDSNSSNENSTTNNTDNESNTSSDEKNSSSDNKNNSPKYTVELGKGLPYSTVVLVKLDTPSPENYKVSVEGNQLELKTNSEGKKVFIKGIKKVYELDEVQKLIKIEKIK